MSKRFIPAAVAALLLAVASGASAQAAQRVGFVNSQRVLASQGASLRRAQETLQREFAPTAAGLDSLQQRLQTGQQSLQQQSALSTQARQQREQELQQLYGQLQERTQQAQQAAQRREAELTAPLYRAISDAIEAERRAAGFAYVLDSSVQFIVAFDPALDLTDRVITRLGGAAAATPRP